MGVPLRKRKKAYSSMHQEPNDNWQEDEKAPGRLLWPIRRVGWFLEKYVLWPISDSFQRIGNAFRYRSPLAYIGVTLLVTVTAGAVAAAVYFYEQSGKNDNPAVADSAIQAETVVPPVPTPTPTPVTDPNAGQGSDNTLQGVVPSFAASGTQKKNANSGKQNQQQLPETVVREAPTPKAAPLKVAHQCASTFVNYEVGDKKAADKVTKTATSKLAKELKKDPPKLPSTGQIPKATVVNVVRGKKDGDQMAVSVSLMRSGASSELRLGLTREKGDGWLVSSVRG